MRKVLAASVLVCLLVLGAAGPAAAVEVAEGGCPTAGSVACTSPMGRFLQWVDNAPAAAGANQWIQNTAGTWVAEQRGALAGAASAAAGVWAAEQNQPFAKRAQDAAAAAIVTYLSTQLYYVIDRP